MPVWRVAFRPCTARCRQHLESAAVGSGSPQILLELTLLDAQVALPAQQRDRTAAGAEPAAKNSSAECTVRVLVSRAAALPKVPVVGGERRGELQAPSPFVALKSSRDAARGGAVQAATQAVRSSCEPTWCDS